MKWFGSILQTISSPILDNATNFQSFTGNYSKLHNWMDHSHTANKTPDLTAFQKQRIAFVELMAEVAQSDSAVKETVTLAELRSITPAKWMDARLVTSSRLRLFHADFPVHRESGSSASNNQQNRAMSQEDHPAPEATWLVVVRSQKECLCHELTARQFHLLSDFHSGFTVGESLERLSYWSDENDVQFPLPEELRDWIESWTTDRFFACMDVKS